MTEMLAEIKTVNGNWNSTAGKFKIYVEGYTWYVNTAEEVQARINQFRPQIVGKVAKIWNQRTGKLLREDVVTA
jgi:hypothetical protein